MVVMVLRFPCGAPQFFGAKLQKVHEYVSEYAMSGRIASEVTAFDYEVTLMLQLKIWNPGAHCFNTEFLGFFRAITKNTQLILDRSGGQ
jgi:hypothetical protein